MIPDELHFANRLPSLQGTAMTALPLPLHRQTAPRGDYYIPQWE
jgi:hypothetical protein